MYQELGLDGVFRWFEARIEEMKSKGRDIFKSELAENIREDIRDYEEMNAFKHYEFTTAEDYTLEERIHQQHFDYFQKFYKVVRSSLGEDTQHTEQYVRKNTLHGRKRR